MKLVIWNDGDVPSDLEITDDGTYAFEDCPFWFNFEVGDQIQYLSSNGTRCFFVIEVTPLADNTLIKLVIIK